MVAAHDLSTAGSSFTLPQKGKVEQARAARHIPSKEVCLWPDRTVWIETGFRLNLGCRGCGHQEPPSWSRLKKQQTAQGEGQLT
jgi:hypothetical protein